MGQHGLRIFGHPVHPMLAGFPIAFWVGASACDGIALFKPETFWSQGAFWLLVAGTTMAIPVAVSGFWDLIRLPMGHPAERVGYWHLGIMTAAFTLNLASLLMRREGLGNMSPSLTAMCLAAGGAILCLGGGWLGGELVFGHGLGVVHSTSRTTGEEPDRS